MNTAFIILAQTKGGAILEFMLLLFVAAIIGYITAWLFYKSVYEKILKEIESDKHQLNIRIINLNGEVVNLQKSLDDKDLEMERYYLEDLAQRNHLIDYNSPGN